MTDTQTRIASLLGHFERMETKLQQNEEHLTPLEALYARQLIDYRREQLVLLREASQLGGTPSQIRTALAKRLGVVAAQFSRKLEVPNEVHRHH